MKNQIQILSMLVVVLFAQSVFAADLYVETTGDDQSGGNTCTAEITPCLTVSHALTQAAENDVIHLGEGDFVETVDLDVAVPVTIAGTSRFVTTVTTASNASNLFEVQIPNTFVDPLVTIQDVRITPSGDGGFCLRHFGNTIPDQADVDVTVADVYFYNCSEADGAAIYYSDAGNLTILTSEFANNVANNILGGAVYVLNSDALSVTDSYFSNNTTPESGSAIAVANTLSVVLSNSTLADNIVSSAGQGAFYCNNCTSATLSNVTFSGNIGSEAPDETSDIFVIDSTLSLSHVTIYSASNADDYLVSQTTSTISSTHSVVYQVDDHAECNEAFASAAAYNLSNGTDCFAGATDITDAADPFVDVPLNDNGGGVFTLEVLLSSSAYNAGDEVCPLATDARGADRPANTNCDIGAFEASCGNAVVEAEFDEDCDEGDVLDGDGCSSACESESTWYQDSDVDTYGNPDVSVMAVENPEGYVSDNTDCDDNNAEVSPEGVDDQCDDVDNNCDGTTDDLFSDVLGDACSDGVGACENTGSVVCTADTLATECSVSAGAATDELCGDDIDNDCDGDTDEGFDVGDACTTGVGACAVTGEMECTDDGTDTECNATAGESADEVCDDDIDNDCDGDTDADDVDCDETPITDTDEDGIADDIDNCPDDSNADQLDSDADGEGDECETSSGSGGCALTTQQTLAQNGLIFVMLFGALGVCKCRLLLVGNKVNL